MSKGTIIYIGGFELPDKNAAAHRVLSNGKIFRELNYNVVFVSVDKSLKFNSSILETKKKIQGFDCWFLPYPESWKDWIHYLSNIEFFIKILKNYNDAKAVIIYNYQAMALMKLKRYCYKNNMKIVADCTEWYNTKGTNIIFKIIKGFDTFLRMRVIQKRLDGLIVISRYLENYYNNCKNIIRLPPLVDLTEEKWHASVPELDNNKINFIYAGSTGKTKDKINCLIESLYELRQINNYTFNIIGITKEQYINDFKEQKKLLDCLGERIKFHGRLSHNESLKYVMTSDFSIFFRDDTRTTKAGFPTKFVESISCGTPVISTNTSDLKDFIIEGENGFFLDMKDKVRMASKLKRILSLDKKIIKDMKKYCLECRTFHYKGFVEDMKKYVQKLDID